MEENKYFRPVKIEKKTTYKRVKPSVKRNHDRK